MAIKSCSYHCTRARHRMRGAGMRAVLAATAIVTLAFAADPAGFGAGASPAKVVNTAGAEPWTKSQLVEPAELAKEVTGDQNARPFVVCVGFKILYQEAHIPGSVLLGPTRDPAGLKSLEDAAQSWPRNRDIVIYCGCCPFSECPNVRPAFTALKRMGFTHLRVLDIPHNFGQDWVRKGLPIEKSAPASGSGSH